MYPRHTFTAKQTTRTNSLAKRHGVVVEGELRVDAGELVNLDIDAFAKFERHRSHTRQVERIGLRQA